MFQHTLGTRPQTFYQQAIKDAGFIVGYSVGLPIGCAISGCVEFVSWIFTSVSKSLGAVTSLNRLDPLVRSDRIIASIFGDELK